MKVILYLQESVGPTDRIYGNEGKIRQHLERETRQKVGLYGFGGYLDGENLIEFNVACEDSDVVLLGTGTHPNGWPDHMSRIQRREIDADFHPNRYLAGIAAGILGMPSNPIMLAVLGDGGVSCPVHKYASPIRDWWDPQIISAIVHARMRRRTLESD